MFISDSLIEGRKNISRIWLCCIVSVLSYLLVQLSAGNVFNSDVMALLPADEFDPARAEAVNKFSANVSRRVFFLVGSSRRDDVVERAEYFSSHLVKSQLFVEVSLRQSKENQKKLVGELYPYRGGLLTIQQRAALREGDYQGLWQGLMRKLSGPAIASVSGQLRNDPLLLFPDFLLQFNKTSGELIDGVVVVDNKGVYYALIIAKVAFSPFAMEEQQLFDRMVSDAESDLSNRFNDAMLLRSGTIFHAIAGTQRAKNDISTIGVGSLLGILLLIVATFRSLYPVMLSLLAISVGIVVGMSANIFIFGQVHIFSLVFGSSLIGVSIDYAFHFFAEAQYASKKSGSEVVRSILPGITLGMITSILGYAMLTVTEFSGLKQIAVFSVTGLLASWLCVVLWFPVFKVSYGRPKNSPVMYLSNAIIKLWLKSKVQIIFIAFLILFIPWSVSILSDIPFNDDIRILQEPSPFQKNQDKMLTSILGSGQESRFILNRASNEQALLELNERVSIRLEHLIDAGKLDAYNSVSSSLPSVSAQQESRGLLQTAFSHSSNLRPQYELIGLQSDTLDAYIHDLNQENFLPDQWLTSELGNKIKFLWLGEIQGNFYSVILLNGITEISAIQSIASSIEGADLVNQADEISRVFGEYRILATKLVFAAYFLIAVVLLLRYGVLKGLLVLIPPCVAAISAMVLAVQFNASINIFHIFSIILVLAIGIDYTLFFAERNEHRSITMLAITLSAITTVLSFGLLALSTTAAMQSFGFTLTVGITVAFLLSPLVGSNKFTLKNK